MEEEPIERELAKSALSEDAHLEPTSSREPSSEEVSLQEVQEDPIASNMFFPVSREELVRLALEREPDTRYWRALFQGPDRLIAQANLVRCWREGAHLSRPERGRILCAAHRVLPLGEDLLRELAFFLAGVRRDGSTQEQSEQVIALEWLDVPLEAFIELRGDSGLSRALRSTLSHSFQNLRPQNLQDTLRLRVLQEQFEFHCRRLLGEHLSSDIPT